MEKCGDGECNNARFDHSVAVGNSCFRARFQGYAEGPAAASHDGKTPVHNRYPSVRSTL